MREPLLQVQGLKKYFPVKGGLLQRRRDRVHAVEGVDFEIRSGQTLSLVGETGCGKSTTGKLVVRLLEPTEGTIRFRGIDLLTLSPREMRNLRREMQIIFQDPFSSLNPRLTIRQTVGEPLVLHEKGSRRERDDKVVHLLRKVGLKPEDRFRYPHEFSGGQRQRVGIARALALNPRLIVADEPVSSLDVSIQAQVTNLLLDLQEELGLSYLFISHDLGLVEHISDEVAVMYLGRIIERGPARSLFANPRHPYTEALLDSIPVRDPRQRKGGHRPLSGDVPSPIHPPGGCPFHPRCPLREEICTQTFPGLFEFSPGHIVHCHVRGKRG